MRKLALFLLIASLRLQAVDPAKHPTCAELLLDEDVTALVVQNVLRVKEFPHNWALALQQIMFQLIVHYSHPALDFAYFEKLFRLHNAPFYLVANSLPLEPGLRLGYPPELAKLKGAEEPSYHLWVGVNGKDEADSLKRQLGVTDEENLERLRLTGFILVDDMKAAAENSAVDLADENTRRRLGRVGVVKGPPDPNLN